VDGLHLPQPYAGKVASLRQLIGWLTDEISLLDAVMADLLEHHQAYRALQQLPGIGPVLAAVGAGRGDPASARRQPRPRHQ